MATYVTLAQAKMHLRLEEEEENLDIQEKLDDAEAIILNYLKGRPLTVSTITRDGATATVTTTHLHGLSTGNTVVIRGANEPEYNGSFSVTVTSTTAFTIPVTGSPATPATGGIGLRASETWTESTVPRAVTAAILLMLGRLYQQRGDDAVLDDENAIWMSIERLLVRYRDPAYA